ncbi:MAG: CheR family methyltransferase [Candidatus Binatia bacterium]
MTKFDLPEPVLTQLSEFISSRMGWHFPPDRWQDLERSISAAARDFGFTNIQACVEWLHTTPFTPQQVEVLADHFTVGETYFFREQQALEILTEHILPPLMRTRQHTDRHLRIWSAACCTGEEPYSIAIMLQTKVQDLADWQISIIGTDINRRFLQKAINGIYGEWSFRNTPAWIKERYFRQTKEHRYTILPQIKQMVTFFPLNLAAAEFPSPLNHTAAIDVIFCRNVFIYFSLERAQTVIRNFHEALLPGGWLIVSPSEISYLTETVFETVQFPRAILHRKADIKAPLLQFNDTGTSTTEQPLLSVATTRLSSSERTLSNPDQSVSLLPPNGYSSSNKAERALLSQAPTPQPSSSPTFSYTEATRLYNQGRYVEAAEKFLALLTSDHQMANFNREEAIFLLIHSYANQGALPDALTWCRKAVAENPVSHRLYYLLATLLLEQGEEQEAVLSLKRTLFLKNDFVLAHVALGNLARRQKKEHEARKHFRNALFLLSQYDQKDHVPESEGLIAGKLSDLLHTMLPRL